MIKNKKGFTLIELIIVMAIIGILAVVAIVAISGKSADARDARRVADISAIQTGLALYCYQAGESQVANATEVDCTPGAAAGVEVLVSTCEDLTVGGEDIIALSGINDPNESTTACTGANSACNYGVTPTADEIANGNIFDSCAYTIYGRLEAGAGTVITATQAGIVKS